MSSEEGYTWHETGPVAAWARGLTEDERNLVGGYVGFGYKEINGSLRGDPPTKKEVVRAATSEEIAEHRVALQQEGQRLAVADGTLMFDMYGHPPFRVEREVVNTERRDQALADAVKIDAFIKDRGYVLQDPITVSRYAYFPGVTPEAFTQDIEGHANVVRTELGFSSTMLGEAGGRLQYGPAAVKADSVYARYGKLDNYNSDVGTAVQFQIVIPASTRVLSVEGIRRTDDRSAALQVSDNLARRDMEHRGESEVLLGSGAKFVVVSAGPGGASNFSGRRAPVTQVRMQYVGGGSSQDPYGDYQGTP